MNNKGAKEIFTIVHFHGQVLSQGNKLVAQNSGLFTYSAFDLSPESKLVSTMPVSRVCFYFLLRQTFMLIRISLPNLIVSCVFLNQCLAKKPGQKTHAIRAKTISIKKKI